MAFLPKRFGLSVESHNFFKIKQFFVNRHDSMLKIISIPKVVKIYLQWFNWSILNSYSYSAISIQLAWVARRVDVRVSISRLVTRIASGGFRKGSKRVRPILVLLKFKLLVFYFVLSKLADLLTFVFFAIRSIN